MRNLTIKKSKYTDGYQVLENGEPTGFGFRVAGDKLVLRSCGRLAGMLKKDEVFSNTASGKRALQFFVSDALNEFNL